MNGAGYDQIESEIRLPTLVICFNTSKVADFRTYSKKLFLLLLDLSFN